MKEKCSKVFKNIQNILCANLEEIDGAQKFKEDSWVRNESETYQGGGGISRVMQNGAVFEKAGINFSEVYGTLPEGMCKQLTGQTENREFFACGTSLVIHPYSPMVPTTHANVRYLEVADLKWFGGGGDLTPYYFYEDDAVEFHKTLKELCDRHDKAFYPKFKDECDKYFYLPHRKEARGIGGVFFDYLGKENPKNLEKYYDFTRELGENILNAYYEIVKRRKSEDFTEEQKKFQLQRRGRYAEFNLVIDRGTKFGLETNGRTESILMSLPPEVHWDYCPEFKKGSKEEEIIKVVSNPPVNWV